VAMQRKLGLVSLQETVNGYGADLRAVSTFVQPQPIRRHMENIDGFGQVFWAHKPVEFIFDGGQCPGIGKSIRYVLPSVRRGEQCRPELSLKGTICRIHPATIFEAEGIAHDPIHPDKLVAANVYFALGLAAARGIGALPAPVTPLSQTLPGPAVAAAPVADPHLSVQVALARYCWLCWLL